MTASIALLVASVLVLLMGLHLYWATGGFWPGTDEASLARTVVGGPEGMRMPTAGACIVVAGLLAGFALVVVASAGWLGPYVVSVARLLSRFGAAVLALRGVEGFFDVYLRPSTRGSRFVRLNRTIYSPLCLGLALLTFLAAGGV